MSAAAQRRAPLELVPQPDPAAADSEWLTGEASAVTDPAGEEPESWQTQTVLNGWEPSTSSSAH